MGRAAKELVGLAERLDVDLVAVGSRGGDRIKRVLMGSVSGAVIHHAHCPVLIVFRKPVVSSWSSERPRSGTAYPLT
jgi:hypothetical protein